MPIAETEVGREEYKIIQTETHKQFSFSTAFFGV